MAPGENEERDRRRIAKRMGDDFNMKELKWKPARGAWALAIAAAVSFALASPGVRALGALPEKLSLAAGSNAVLDIDLPGSAQLDSGSTRATLTQRDGSIEILAGEESGSANLIFRLLGIVPVKKVEVEVSPERRLIPGGQSVGIAIETEGLVVVGTSDLGRSASPARLAGLSSGDVITEVNGNAVRTPAELEAQLRAGEAATVTVMRDGAARTFTLTPAADPRDGSSRIGAWVRSSTAGVGTLTFVDPETGAFGALGHAISDVDTGITLPVADGGLYESRVVEVRKGERGAPGEIVGDFFSDEKQIGDVRVNCAYGVYGTDYEGDASSLYPDGLPVGTRSQTHTGAAQILTTVDDRVRTYDCEIEHLEPEGGEAMRSIVVHVTDPALIERAGGIVQGMSGSPILQDGRIVGAVTHVFVNDPTRGYGIGIEAMLDAMPTAERSAVTYASLHVVHVQIGHAANLVTAAGIVGLVADAGGHAV